MANGIHEMLYMYHYMADFTFANDEVDLTKPDELLNLTQRSTSILC
jgi:hypothetical protein